MASPFTQVIEFRPRAGRWLAPYGTALALLVACALAGADMDWRWTAFLSAAVVCRLAGGLRGYLSPFCRDYVAWARLLPSGAWQLEIDGCRPIGASLARCWGDGYGPVMALQWSCDDGRQRQAWLCVLDLHPATWRRLRVRLSLA